MPGIQLFYHDSAADPPASTVSSASHSSRVRIDNLPALRLHARQQLTVQVKLAGIRTAASHRQGAVKATSNGDTVTFILPLGLTDTIAPRK